jgi:hypothetical protein
MVTIPTKLKQFFILSLTFGIVYWFQIVDDKKRCKERVGIYEKIKLPLLVSSMVGLVLFWENDKILNIFVTSECKKIDLPAHELVNVANVPNNIPNMEFNNLHINNRDFFKQPEFDVYTGLPEW